jgi:hypothetical protein
MAAKTREYRLQRIQPPDKPHQLGGHMIGAYEGEACVHADAVVLYGQTSETVARVVDALNDRGAEDTARIDGLRRLCGYVENGSASHITISLDDATKNFTIHVGPSAAKRWSHGEGFREAIDAAIKEHGDWAE